IFQVNLGSVNGMSLPFNEPYYLGIKIGTDPELKPRMLLTTSPYSFRAEDANHVGGIRVSDTPEPHVLFPLGNDAKFPASVLPAGTPSGNYLKKGEPETSRGTSNDPMLLVSNSGKGDGLVGESVGGVGVSARSDNSEGVVGWTAASGKSGVFGHSTNGRGVVGRSENDNGVIGWTGHSDKNGVLGHSTDGYGVRGFSNGYHKAGVIGENYENEGYGVHGLCSVNGIGVYGESNDVGPGVYGNSAYGKGVYGEGRTGVFGTGYHIGVRGSSTSGDAVFASGSFAATGTKSAEVKLKNGTPIRLFAEEATEVYFNDYGEGTLSSGRAHIELDPIFLQTVTVNEQHPMKVFVQLEDDCNGVYVTNKATTGFDVAELHGGTSNAQFTYRVICKRKYYEGERLATQEQDSQYNKRMMETVWPEIIEKHEAEMKKMKATPVRK
ncbi:MAG: hypothetical protein JSW07_16725, partial [bacterium]